MMVKSGPKADDRKSKSATLMKVAEKAGVSKAAVSRTFNEGRPVSPEMRRKVEKAAAELGYFPNALASSLTTGRTRLIGLIADNFDNPFFLEVFDLLTAALQDANLRPMLINLKRHQDVTHSIRLLQQYSVDGVMLTAANRPQGFGTAIRKAGIPVVHVFGPLRSSPSVHVVGTDNIESGRLAARTLYERGYRRIGFLGGAASTATTMDRAKGFLSQAQELSGVVATDSYADNYSFDDGYHEMSHLLSSNPAEAYFCADDILSIGALSAIRSQGLRIPQDIGILGLNDMAMAGWRDIELTTIRQPVGEIVRSSVELLGSTLSTDERYPETRTFSCQLVERKTLRPVVRQE